ncbi:MAG: CYTH domain-containing protein [Patescibacteria group bacterium]|nr:CYTH domain-containing protein [Patescibacteria group bacterium]
MSKQKNIEVEVRGPISKKKLLELEKIFRKSGRFKTLKERVLIDYSTFLPNGNMRERTKDIRLRITNGIPEIIVKLGKAGGLETRKELSVLVGKGEFETLVQIFGALGLVKGALCVRKSRVYDYRGVEFALVEVPNHSYYFEAEKLVSDEEDLKKAEKDLKNICQELNLSLFSDEEFYNYIEILNKEANEVFDFDNYREGYFKNRFGV